MEIDENVPYGSIPSYDGELPTKESTSQYSYTFSGWTPEIEKAIVNAEYYAAYSSSAINYSISYDLDGGEGSNPTSYSIETGNITLSEPTKNGYEFIGWTGSNGTVPQKDIVIDCKSASDYSFTANWKLLTYTITYHLFEGENNIKNPETYTIEDTITLNPAKKDFYNFEGWYLDADFENRITSLNGYFGDINLYAKYIPFEFNATFDIDGSDSYFLVSYYSDSVLSMQTKVYVGNNFNLYNYLPTKEGYIFDGWYDNSGNLITDSNIFSSINVYAKWFKIPESYTVYDLSLKSISCGGLRTEINSSFYPSIRYFYIPSYCSGSDLTLKYQLYAAISARAPSSALSRSATSTGELIEVDTGNVIWGERARKASSANYTSSSSKTLNDTIELDLKSGHLYKLTASVVLSGRTGYSAGESTLNISQCNEIVTANVISDTISIAYDSKIPEILPYKDGYDFMGWYDEKNEPIHGIWDYTSDKSFHAEWVLHEYKIYYDLDGGINNPSNPSSFYCTDNIDFLSPSKDGYTFDGWYSDPDFNNKITSIQSGELYSDINLYAKWIANTYTVTLDYDGGQLCPVVEFYSEDSLIKSVPLFKDKTLDYFVPESSNPSLVFAGWYTDPEFKNRFSFEGKIDVDLKLYAKWVSIENQYANFGNDVEVTINGKDERYIEVVCLEDQTIEISSSSDLDLYGAIYDENMNLIISNDDISDTDLDFSFIANLEAGHKYYILYRANQAKVQGSAVINIGGKQIPDSCITGNYNVAVDKISVTYGEPFTLPKPYKEGYEFIGWYDENGNPIDASTWNYLGNTTIYAHWSKI